MLGETKQQKPFPQFIDKNPRKHFHWSLFIVISIAIAAALLIYIQNFKTYQEIDSMAPVSLKDKQLQVKESGYKEFVVPNYVYIFGPGNYNKPTSGNSFITLSAIAGGGCDRTSDLKIKQYLVQNSLTVEILGFSFSKASGKDACITMILESQAKVDLEQNWLKQKTKKYLIFKLNGKENKYEVVLTDNQISILPISAQNVVTNTGHNSTNQPDKLNIKLK